MGFNCNSITTVTLSKLEPLICAYHNSQELDGMSVLQVVEVHSTFLSPNVEFSQSVNYSSIHPFIIYSDCGCGDHGTCSLVENT